MKDKDSLHRLLSTKMLIAGVNNAEVAANVAMEVINEHFPDVGIDEATQRRIKFMEDSYDRQPLLSHEAKEKHKRVEREFILKQKGRIR